MIGSKVRYRLVLVPAQRRECAQSRSCASGDAGLAVDEKVCSRRLPSYKFKNPFHVFLPRFPPPVEVLADIIEIFPMMIGMREADAARGADDADDRIVFGVELSGLVYVSDRDRSGA